MLSPVVHLSYKLLLFVRASLGVAFPIVFWQSIRLLYNNARFCKFRTRDPIEMRL
jgi:hypothetical protein